jgi:hypothetical protein
MQDYENTAPTAPKRVRLVDPDQVADRGTDARLGNV